MKITFLGTAAMQPTRERNLPSVLISHGAEDILIDCGEGTQRQMKIARVKPKRLTKILISHWHGDHVIGLAGLMRYLAANEYTKTLEIYGSTGIRRYFENMMHSCIFEEKVKVKLIGLKEGVFFKGKDFRIEAVRLEHSCPCFGFSFIEADRRKIRIDYCAKLGLRTHPLLGQLQRGHDIVWKGKKIKVKDATTLIKGKKLTIIADTRFCRAAVKLAKGADMLISEATFLEDLKERAAKFKHLTAKQSAKIAKAAGVKQLVLTHLSQRYKDPAKVIQEAKTIFKNVSCAKDFMTIEL